MKKEIEEEKYNKWIESANIANKYGKDGWISTLKNAIDILILEAEKRGYEKGCQKLKE